MMNEYDEYDKYTNINIDNYYDWDEIQTQNYNMLNFERELTIIELKNISNYPTVINNLIYIYYNEQKCYSDIIDNVIIKKRNNTDCEKKYPHVYNYYHYIINCDCLPWKIQISFQSIQNSISEMIIFLYDPYVLIYHSGISRTYNRYSLTLFEMIIEFMTLIHLHIRQLSNMKIKIKTEYDKHKQFTYDIDNDVLKIINIINNITKNFYKNNTHLQ